MSVRTNDENVGYASSDTRQKLNRELESLFDFAITNSRDALDMLDEIKKVAQWYQEKEAGQDGGGKRNHSEILTAVSNKLIEVAFEKTAPYLEKLMIKGLDIKLGKIEQDIKTIDKMQVKFDLEHYVEFAKNVDGLEVEKCKITFKVAGSGKLEKIKIHHTSDGIEIDIAKFSVPVSVSITKLSLKIAHMPLPKDSLLPKPITLCQNRLFQIGNISFNFSKAVGRTAKMGK